jgi:hypothetical protein
VSRTTGSACSLKAKIWNRAPGGERALPFRRLALRGCGQVAQPDDVDDPLGEHAGRGVEQDEHALAADLQSGQVLAVAFAGEGAQTVALLDALAGASLQPFQRLVVRLEIRLQAIDVRLAGDAVGLELREVVAASGDVLGHRPRLGEQTLAALAGLRHARAERRGLGPAARHLALPRLDLPLERIGRLAPLGDGVVAQDEKQQQHGAEAAADGVEKRHAERRRGPALLHRRRRYSVRRCRIRRSLT